MDVKLTTCKIKPYRVVVFVEYVDYYGEHVLQKAYSPRELLVILQTIANIYGSLYIKHVIL